MKKITLIFLAALVLPAAASAKTVRSASIHGGMDIAATVGDEAVTSYDVANRIRFIIATAHLPNTPDVIARIRPQVVRSLIDERLELKEAGANDITITDDDVKRAIAILEQERHMEPGTIARIMQQDHVPASTFTEQIRAQLAWNRLIVKKVRPLVHVSDEEIAMAARRPRPAPANLPQEIQVAVLSLPVDKPAREGEVRKIAEHFSQEIRGGASFEEVSRQFSSRASAAGGRVEKFWVQPDQLDPAIAKALGPAKVGTVTDPVRTREGYLIVKVYDVHAAPPKQQEMAVNLKEIVLKLKSSASKHDADLLLQIANDTAKHPGSCTDKTISGIENPDDVDIKVDFHRSPLSALPAGVRTVVEGLKVGDISTPLASDDGLHLYMLCDERPEGEMPPDHDELYKMLMEEKLELEAAKYLRRLRRETYIDMRG